MLTVWSLLRRNRHTQRSLPGNQYNLQKDSQLLINNLKYLMLVLHLCNMVYNIKNE